jgi:DNA-binding NarL/FixJ family response regulator
VRTPPWILIVDDDPSSLDILQARLASFDYKILTARDGEEALTVAREQLPDLILLDIVLPKLDGITVCRRLKADATLPFIPIIMVTAKVASEDVVAGLEAGGDEYLAKPVDPDALVARVKSMLRIKALQDTIREQAGQLQAQAAQLTEWNQTLERRVADQLAELERAHRLKRFLAPQVAEIVVSSGGETHLKSHRQEIAVVSCRLVEFPAFAEAAEPETVMEILKEFYTAMGELVFREEGTLERFTGDGLMVFFNDPLECPDPESRAVRMAVAMKRRIQELRGAWLRQGYKLDLGVGIAQGYATLGQIGFEGRLDYGAIGIVTHLASSLCDEARPGQILVTQRVHAAVEDHVEAEPLGDRTLRGFVKPVPVYNVLRLKETAQPPEKPSSPLSRREEEVAARVAAGLSNREIAKSLFIGERTVETHVQNILNKLGFHTRTQIAAWAVAQGLHVPQQGP